MTPQHPAAPETETDANGLRELLAAATPRPWEARIGGSLPWIALYDDEDKIPEGESLPSFEPGGTATHADAALIVAAVNALPALLADLDAARERVRVVEGERDAARAEVARAEHVTDTLVERAQRIGMSVRAADPSRYAGWTEDQWAADAVAIMDSIDGSCAELVNGHVNALIRKAARAESAEAAHEAEKAAHERLRAGVEALADGDLWEHADALHALLLGGGGAR